MCRPTEFQRRWNRHYRFGWAVALASLGGLFLIGSLLLGRLAAPPAQGGGPGRVGWLPPPPTPLAMRSAGTPVYILAGDPRCPEPNRPCGVPLARTDWVITKDYAAHGGPGPWGAVDFAFWWNRDALGTPVLATHHGRVFGVRDDLTYGNRVYVQNGQWTTIYSHLQAILVPDDQWVERGQLIGLMGSTGKSTGVHVDYQVWEAQAAEAAVNRNPHDYCACAQAGSDPAPLDPQPPGRHRRAVASGTIGLVEVGEERGQMLTVVQSIFAGTPLPPTEVPMHLVLPNGLALVSTPAELATLVRAIREEIRAQVRPGQPTGRIIYALPGQRPLQSSARAWLRLADWIEETIQPPRPPGGEIRARFPAAAGTTAAWMAPAAVSGRTTRLVSTTSGPLCPPAPGADPRAGGIDPADPCSPLTSVPQQYRVRVLIPDRQVVDGWGPHPDHREEIEVWAGSLATASLFVVLDPQQPITIEPGHLVAARWVWRAFQTPNTDHPWTHPYTCFLDAAQIAMIRLELDRQTELLI